MAAADITTKTDAELDAIYNVLCSRHRGATGPVKADLHTAIMKCVAEFSRRIDVWLANR